MKETVCLLSKILEMGKENTFFSEIILNTYILILLDVSDTSTY